MPVPAKVIETPATRPRTMIFNRVWFYPPIMPEVFRIPPVPVVRVEPQVAQNPSAKDEEFFGGAVGFDEIWGG